MKTYFVQSKGDDYSACVTELVQATEKNAKKYYHSTEVAPEDVEILKKYLGLVEMEEEAERSDDERFYGNS